MPSVTTKLSLHGNQAVQVYMAVHPEIKSKEEAINLILEHFRPQILKMLK